jgi:hypothetical protein
MQVQPDSADTSFPKRSTGSYSLWSGVSLVLLALAITCLLPLVYPRHAAGPALAGAQIFATILLSIVAWCCTFLGAITGWVGIRRSSSDLGLPWAGLGLNSALCFAGIILALLSRKDDSGLLSPPYGGGVAKLILPITLVLIGMLFSAPILARDSVGRWVLVIFVLAVLFTILYLLYGS